VRRLLIIGIGAGDPEHVTAQAIRALNEVDVFFVVEKGDEKHDLVDLRREICERYIDRPAYRTVELQDPERDRTAAAYGAAVEAWRHARAALYAEAIARELAPGECGAFMVWGDPALYDSTLAIADEILAGDPGAFEHEVVPEARSSAGDKDTFPKADEEFVESQTSIGRNYHSHKLPGHLLCKRVASSAEDFSPLDARTSVVDRRLENQSR